MPPRSTTPTSALLRYQARFHSWFTMITSEYAWGMLGDFVPPPRLDTPPPSAPPAVRPPRAGPPRRVADPAAGRSRRRSPSPIRRRRASRRPRRRPRAPPPASPPVWPPPQPPPTTASGAPGRHASALLVGAHRASRLGRSVAALGHPRPPGRGPVLDDLRHRLGLDRLHRRERLPELGGNHNHTTTGQLNTVPADTSGLSHVVGHGPPTAEARCLRSAACRG